MSSPRQCPYYRGDRKNCMAPEWKRFRKNGLPDKVSTKCVLLPHEHSRCPIARLTERDARLTALVEGVMALRDSWYDTANPEEPPNPHPQAHDALTRCANDADALLAANGFGEPVDHAKGEATDGPPD